MTAIQLNAQMLRDMSIIAEDQHLLARAAKYLRRLVREKEDPTLMTKEEFFARVDRAKAQYERGEAVAMLPNENLTQFLRRQGYDI